MSAINVKFLPVVGEIYIPVAKAKVEHKQRLIDRFGGATMMHSHGHWRDDEGTVVSEPVYIYRVHATKEEDVTDVFGDLAGDLLVAGEQAVLFTINGVGFMWSRA